MRKFAAKEAKDSFGLLLDTAQKEPVIINKKGRPVAVVLSMEDYQRFEAMEDAYWAAKAREAGEEGFIGISKSEKLLKAILDAED